MRKKELEKQIRQCQDRVYREIAANSHGSHLAGGLATEGFAGGYLSALSDVLLLLNNVDPGNNRRYWESWRR